MNHVFSPVGNTSIYQLERSLLRLQTAYAALLSIRQTPHETLATLRAELDEQWQAELLPVMNDLYWHPFRNGLDEAPEDPAELESWLERHYDEAAIIAILLLLLQRYQVRAYNLGGQIALDMLGIDATFRLEDADILAALDTFAEELVTRGTEYSLLDTTIADLVEAVPRARRAEGSALLALSAFIAMRAAQRTEMIERSERPRQVAAAQDETYRRNGVAYMMYDVAGVGCVRVCAPWHGTVFAVGAQRVRIPQHPHCDCIWSPILFDGQTVGLPPVVVSVPGLTQWTPPATIWSGGP